MATVVSSAMAWTINAPFMQELKEYNVELWQSLDELKNATQGGVPTETLLSNFVPLLSKLKERLAAQFKLEETYAYVQTAMHGAKRMSAQVERVLSQHRPIYLYAQELAEKAEESEYRGKLAEDMASLIREAIELFRRIEDHESAEQRLITGNNFGI